MLNDEIASCLAKFFDGGRGPSHDDLDRLFRRTGLAGADPRSAGDSVVGKMKRVREVLGAAIDQRHEQAWPLVKLMVDQLRACGCFRGGAEQFAGTELIEATRAAFRRVGYELDPAGVLRPRLLEGLEGRELTGALWSYVRRAQAGANDAELVIGTAKNLEEAVARHVLTERAGGYSVTEHFPTTLFNAFIALGLQPSQVQLDSDPRRALEQAVFLLACAVNRLRNAKGDGHGRPTTSTATGLESRLSAQAAGLVAELLLSTLAPSQSGGTQAGP